MRSETRIRLAAISSQTAERAGMHTAATLARLPAFEACRRVALYASLPDELPSRPLFDRARAAGKILLWPRIDRGGLVFARCDAWEALVPGRFGVLAPLPEAPAESLDSGDLLLVPGRAFDATGARLGRGGGHFDRVLARRGATPAVGVAFSCQLVKRVPVEPHDQSVDAVLVESQLVTSRPVEENR
ncbi:MAG: 5-formyltetrahydrofolate cyclo-ligase [bacterium]|nr:5-formyltetrahydrofolate cyclo-ligase [bacterium]MCP5069926.1 5-formyltetrahydrofolate cyclo-ligase [bacterium]